MIDALIDERRAHLYSELNSHGLQLRNDGFVEWKHDENRHPRNWNVTKKAFTVDLLCFFDLWMTAISSSGVRFPLSSSSACAALSLSRTVMAAIFPLFTYQMYTGLGGNVAMTIFAAIATSFCITPVVFNRYGRKLRSVSRFAQGDDDGDDKDEETGSTEEA